ncbi:DUF4389 domain-containing protein [Streptomyces sp. SID5785]|uniref:DUF4389 domain-containing protein n=1 Tax=Streptomyces sp. SID5785 TaxID=2690309 RepID=UPI0013613B31|nr:DUF4389 domain-containing protein [Streptomyces sp. SID5785]MZD06758.1 DUF4389 domain-containing protein [Streptomyces sp. SID5785]
MSTSPGFGTVPLLPGTEPLPELEVPPPGRQNRCGVLLRLLVLLPHALVLLALAVAAVPAAVAAWCGALLLGRAPEPLERFLAAFVAYEARWAASAMLLTDRLPPLLPGGPLAHPVQLRLHSGPLNRAAVLLRPLLMLPAVLVGAVVTAGWWAVSFLSWLVVLVLGRMPLPLFGASAAVLRYRMRVGAYVLLLSSAYPKRLFGDQGSVDSAIGVVRGPSGTRPLFLGASAKVLLGAFLVLGAVGWAVSP